MFTVITAAFDIYSLGMAAPGSTHYGYYFISYEFVYVGNNHIRNALIMFAFFSLVGGLAILVTGVMLVVALRKVSRNPGCNCGRLQTVNIFSIVGTRA